MGLCVDCSCPGTNVLQPRHTPLRSRTPLFCPHYIMAHSNPRQLAPAMMNMHRIFKEFSQITFWEFLCFVRHAAGPNRHEAQQAALPWLPTEGVHSRRIEYFKYMTAVKKKIVLLRWHPRTRTFLKLAKFKRKAYVLLLYNFASSFRRYSSTSTSGEPRQGEW